MVAIFKWRVCIWGIWEKRKKERKVWVILRALNIDDRSMHRFLALLLPRVWIVKLFSLFDLLISLSRAHNIVKSLGGKHLQSNILFKAEAAFSAAMLHLSSRSFSRSQHFSLKTLCQFATLELSDFLSILFSLLTFLDGSSQIFNFPSKSNCQYFLPFFATIKRERSI